MPSLSEVQSYLALTALLSASLLGIALSGRKLSETNGSDVRVVWYLFSLSITITFIIAAWASKVGAIDDKGLFQGHWGSALHSLLNFMLDLETDITIFSAILAIVVLPQFFSYLLSGLFGCASSPILVGKAMSFFVWSIVKSFVVVSGILLTVSVYGWLQEWDSWSLKGAASMACLAAMLIALSFACLIMYRDMDRGGTETPIKTAPFFQQKRNSIKRWLTRKTPVTNARNTSISNDHNQKQNPKAKSLQD